VIRIAEIEGVDAIHPGIGFLSESPQYARICREHGLNFIGPRSDNMDLMGNKSNAINTAKRLKIPVVPGSEGALANSS
ncbi:MAG: biotin carboxylase N-terminal domain-containing protein, partial [SAR324 cluster bacterium]|nr:biotin carboxylase N-terminal domain-containing protein [SAR324 cluster bacterium]